MFDSTKNDLQLRPKIFAANWKSTTGSHSAETTRIKGTATDMQLDSQEIRDRAFQGIADRREVYLVISRSVHIPYIVESKHLLRRRRQLESRWSGK